MPLQVLLLYPPPSLTPARVASDLAQQQCRTHSLTWLKLQDDALDASGSSIRAQSTSPLKVPTHDDVNRHVGTELEPLADNAEVDVTTNSVFPIKPSTRSTTRNRESLRAWKSHNVTFDMTHEVATIPYYDSSAESQQQHQMLTRSTIKSSAQGHRGLISGFEANQIPKKRKYHPILAEDSAMPQSRYTFQNSTHQNVDSQKQHKNVPRTRLGSSKSAMPTFAFYQESDRDVPGRRKPRNSAKVTEHTNTVNGHSMDGDDEDSCPAVTRATQSIPNTHNFEGEDVPLQKSMGPPTGTTKRNNNGHVLNLASREQTNSESRQYDITNFEYGGAVDSQVQSVRPGRHNQEATEPVTHSKSGLRPMDPPEETQRETQFSSGTQSYQAGTYESHPTAATARSGPDTTVSVTASNEAASFAPHHDLPIINVSALSHLHELQHMPRANNQSCISILAVVFEVGELKEIAPRRNERGVPIKGPERSLKLCTVKACQPSPDGHGRMSMIDVTMWGEMADRIYSGDYRLIKGDIVWFNNLQLKMESSGRECSLQTRATPPSDYRIFYRTFPRVPQKGSGGEGWTAESRMDNQLRAAEHMTSEPGIRRTLSLARWIREEWSSR